MRRLRWKGGNISTVIRRIGRAEKPPGWWRRSAPAFRGGSVAAWRWRVTRRARSTAQMMHRVGLGHPPLSPVRRRRIRRRPGAYPLGCGGCGGCDGWLCSTGEVRQGGGRGRRATDKKNGIAGGRVDRGRRRRMEWRSGEVREVGSGKTDGCRRCCACTKGRVNGGRRSRGNPPGLLFFFLMFFFRRMVAKGAGR